MTDQPIDNNIENREQPAFNTRSQSLRDSNIGNEVIESEDNSTDSNNPSETSLYTMATFDTQMESFIKNILTASPTDDTGKSMLNAGIINWDAFEMFDPDEADYLEYIDGSVTKTPSMIMKKRIKYARFYLTKLRDDKDTKADDPTTWVPAEFTAWWRSNARQFIDNLAHTAKNTAFNTSLSAPALKQVQYKDDTNLNNWKKRGSPSKTDYVKLTNDSSYVSWKPRLVRRAKLDNWDRLIDPKFDVSKVRNGSDAELLKLQYIFMEEILDYTLLTQKGKSVVRLHPGDPQTIWKKHEAHQTSSDASRSAGTKLIGELSTMTISNSTSRVDFLEEFDTKIKTYTEIMNAPLQNDIKVGFLQTAVKKDGKLMSQYSVTRQNLIASGTTTAGVTYEKYIDDLRTYAALEDDSRPMATFLEDQYYDAHDSTPNQITEYLAKQHVSDTVINEVRDIYAARREFKPQNEEADLTLDVDFRKAWSRLPESDRIAILHCKSDTRKKNQDLLV